jgi:hypothetical protein
MTPREFFDHRVNLLLERSDRFQRFMQRFKTKIDSSIRNAGNDDNNLYAVFAELEFACLVLLNPRLDLDYCPTETTRTPDFVVTGDGIMFFAEVKRIGLTSVERELFEIEQRIEQIIEAVPSGLSVYMAIEHLNGERYNTWEEFFADFNGKCSSVVDELVTLVVRMDKELKHDEIRDGVPVGDFANMVSVLISKPSGKKDINSTDFAITFYPVFYKQNERLKLLDAIIDNIDQLRAGFPNVLYIRGENSTYDPIDAEHAIQEFILKPRNDDMALLEEKLKIKYVNRADFETKLRRLSTFQFRNNWGTDVNRRTYQWINSTAEYPLPDWINDHLRTAV